MIASDAERSVVHARFAGRSEEVPLARLGLHGESPDDEIKQALTTFFDLPTGSFDDEVVVRHRTAIVVRPEALYG